MDGLSKAELATLLEIISDCLFCTSIDRFHEIVNAVGSLLQSGNIVLLSSRIYFNNETRNIEEINVSYPVEWTDIYRTRNYIHVDPIVSLGRTGLLYWKEIYKESPPDKEFYLQAKSFSLTNGFSHILSHNKGFGLMSIADAHLRDSVRNRSIINHVAPHLHHVAAKIVHEKSRSKFPPLSPRECEVLRWVIEGKTNWEISQILCISQESIKSHIANILPKLEATNRAHAAAIALQYDLLPSF